MKITRNEPCVCGSGKKYKNCCSNKSLKKDSSRLIYNIIVTLLILVSGLTIYSIYEFYQEDRPGMEAYQCDNPNCGKVHYRPIVSQAEKN